MAAAPGWQHVTFVTGSKGNQYEIKRNLYTGIYGCSCPSWKFGGQMSCKHVRMLRESGQIAASPVMGLVAALAGMAAVYALAGYVARRRRP